MYSSEGSDGQVEDEGAHKKDLIAKCKTRSGHLKSIGAHIYVWILDPHINLREAGLMEAKSLVYLNPNLLQYQNLRQ